MHQWNKADILVHIDMIIGGRIAEEIVFGKENVSAGASSDLCRATHTAERMIKELGFSDSVSITRLFQCIVSLHDVNIYHLVYAKLELCVSGRKD